MNGRLKITHSVRTSIRMCVRCTGITAIGFFRRILTQADHFFSCIITLFSDKNK